MKRLWAVLLIVALLAGTTGVALAAGKVKATGSVNLRKGPGLGYGKVAAVKKGTTLDYLGEISTDSRGVDWYKVRYRGKNVWISSRYSKITSKGTASAAPASNDAAPTVEPTEAPTATPVPGPTLIPTVEGDTGIVELSNYYLADLKETAKALGLDGYTEDNISELKNLYFNDALLAAGNDVAEHFRLTGEGYSIFGATVGMKVEDARAALTAAGLTPYDTPMDIYFEHPAGEGSPVDADGFDSGISVVGNADGIVTEISWSTYTG